MAIAELEGDSVVTDALHPQDSDTRELPWAITAPALAQDVDLAHLLLQRRVWYLTSKYPTMKILLKVF